MLGFVGDENQDQNLVVSCSYCLLVHLVPVGLVPVEPGIGSYFSWKLISRSTTEQCGEGKTIRREVLAGEPALGNLRRAGKPFLTVRAMAHQNGSKIFILHEADRRCYPASVEFVGNHLD